MHQKQKHQQHQTRKLMRADEEDSGDWAARRGYRLRSGWVGNW